MFSFAISQRSLERIGLSIAALVLVGFATVLSVLFFLQVKTIIFVFILIMCFLFSQYQKTLRQDRFRQSFPHDFFAAFYLQCKLQLLAQTSWPSRDGNLSALHIFIEVIWGWKSGYGNIPPPPTHGNLEMKIQNKKLHF